jgi:hypothetical protein
VALDNGANIRQSPSAFIDLTLARRGNDVAALVADVAAGITRRGTL